MVIKKRKKQGNKQDRIFLIASLSFLFTIAGVLIFSNLKIAKKREEMNFRVEVLEQEIDLLMNKKKELEMGLSENEKQSYWESRARELGYKKPGETVVVVKRDAEVIASEETPEKKGVLGDILKNIFD